MLANAYLKTIQNCTTRSAIFARINPQLFDVSLRDGIQNADPAKWPTEAKTDMYHRIVATERPQRMEVGSLVSPKILPVLGDSLYMYSYTDTRNRLSDGPMAYMLVPSLSRIHSALNYDIRNLSFITSVSESFQKKNTRRTLAETKSELKQMSDIASMFLDVHTKLYISCITECPLSGKQDLDYVLREILMYHTSYQFDELCLSDTCGTLTFDDYEYLVDTLIHFGVPASKLSLHLHVSEANRENVRRILWHSFQHKINKFDVSAVETGGCSVTMRSDQLLPNLSYDLFYHFLARYIEYYVDLDLYD
jgi:hydroxymethylglutaryl-CoA lyase